MGKGDNTAGKLLNSDFLAAVLVITLIGMAGAANYMYERTSVNGAGYKNIEMIISTQEGFRGAKLVEKESGSGNVITEKDELEAERQIGSGCDDNYYIRGDGINPITWNFFDTGPYGGWATGIYPMDYINFTKEAEFEYMPVSYQTGEYNQKWIEKLCVQNYRIGAVLTEMYTRAEHLQKTTEIKTRLYNFYDPTLNWMQFHEPGDAVPAPCCTGVLEANLNSNVIGVAHIGWLSREPAINSKGRHNEWGRSVEDLTGVFSIEKFIQLWGNSTCGTISVDWLPCV